MYIADTDETALHVYGCPYAGCDKPVRIVDTYRSKNYHQNHTVIEFACAAGPLHNFEWVLDEISGAIQLLIRTRGVASDRIQLTHENIQSAVPVD